MADRPMDNAPHYRYSESLPKVDLLSLHRARVGVDSNNTPSSPSVPSLEASKHPTIISSKTIPMRDRSSTSERSSSGSPVKSAAPTPSEPVTQFCLCQPDPKIPRPRNAFILFRQALQGQVGAQHPGLANPDISKIIGEKWRQLDQVEKDKWKAMAEDEKKRHQQQYPDYRYQPRRNGRDGSRSLSSGLNPSGSTICIRCGGRIMNAPTSPDTVFNGGSVSSGRPSHADMTASRSYSSDHPRSLKHGSHGHGEHRPSRARQWDESGSQSPDTKRRRTNPQVAFKADFRHDRSPPRSPYGLPSYGNRTDSVSARGLGHAMQAPRGLRSVKEHPHSDPSLTLAPLKTPASVAGSATPVTPYPQEGFNVETEVMKIHYLNKISVLAKIAPQMEPSFREGDGQRRGPVIAVDGQDATLVKYITDYLNNTLRREGKFDSRIFGGPEIVERKREGSAEPEEKRGKQEYFNRISKWHQISEEIRSFVTSGSSRHSTESTTASVPEEDGSPRISPRTIIPKAADMSISSPPASSSTLSETASSPPETVVTTSSSPSSLPVAIVPRYQLTNADLFACAVPIEDSYSFRDHWQWMAAMWRGAVGPDITVYVRECDAEELKQVGNPVEIRLHDYKAIVVRKSTSSPKELEEKVLKRLGFEIEDYITQ
ncbi:hypothetical protein BDV18DRAFT_162649 [Aspergillus unguis]